jgi:hypothetical protein
MSRARQRKSQDALDLRKGKTHLAVLEQAFEVTLERFVLHDRTHI